MIYFDHHISPEHGTHITNPSPSCKSGFSEAKSHQFSDTNVLLLPDWFYSQEVHFLTGIHLVLITVPVGKKRQKLP